MCEDCKITKLETKIERMDIILKQIIDIMELYEVSLYDASSVYMGLLCDTIDTITPRYTLKYLLSFPRYWWRKLRKKS